ncbi:hypothetical protein O1W68_21255 [Rhodococcus sp. H36-A4]|uniref:hypothetical protein n=1 Tax=Rhodococcus sp. H36-A4 TaxID=3004353 RepID=UPI0022AFBB15|nr:hypothetical protein [Rhodococcus sp. H36-A4]MCZ4080472.1 hypothetical protein [Rhodococcus sp. H36-A4]
MKHSRYWALAAASVVVVVFGSAQTTGALWRDQDAIAGGTITSGTLDIKVGPSGTEVNNYTLAALGSKNLGPNGFSQAPLSIRNAGNQPFNYRLQGTSVSGATPIPFNLTITKVAAAANCVVNGGAPTGSTTVLFNGPASSAQVPVAPAARLLAPTANEVWCFRLATVAEPPQSATSQVAFSFRADQT